MQTKRSFIWLLFRWSYCNNNFPYNSFVKHFFLINLNWICRISPCILIIMITKWRLAGICFNPSSIIKLLNSTIQDQFDELLGEQLFPALQQKYLVIFEALSEFLVVLRRTGEKLKRISRYSSNIWKSPKGCRLECSNKFISWRFGPKIRLQRYGLTMKKQNEHK